MSEIEYHRHPHSNFVVPDTASCTACLRGDPETSVEVYTAAEVATLITEAEERGAARVRERVEAVLPDHARIAAEHWAIEDEGGECGCSYKDCYECGKWHACTHGTTGLTNAVRTALGGDA